MKKTYVANQSREMIFGKMNFSSNEQKLLLVLISQIDTLDNHIKPITTTLKDMSAYYGKNVRKEHLKRTLERLNKPIWIETDKSYIMFNVFNEIHVEKGNSDITFYFHERMEKHLLHLNNYVKTNIKNIIPLKSIYSIRIYQFLKANLYKKEKYHRKHYVELDYLKEILLTPKSYKDFSLFKTKVLNPAFKEINKETDIEFTYNLHKKGKKIIGIEFDIKKNIKSQRIKDERVFKREQA